MRCVFVLLVLLLGVGSAVDDATAQPRVDMGPRVGFDMANVEELLIGADVRIAHSELAIEFQSALDVYLPANGSFTTLSANVLYPIPVEDGSRLHPYAGGGLGISFYDTGGTNQSDAGLNLVGGARFPTSGALTPFVQTQITLGTVDLIALSGGVLLSL